ncbi:hypothetical protein L1049_013077 [Liquidambar formosana]|uniref:Uncharacterized protein n=1 Tax=Liquidambar formosana TaxID=63359 RepID=A0AAP0WXE6_LIQFO
MAAIVNFLCLVLFLTLVGKGTCQCTLGDITIEQAATGAVVKSKPEWKAVITNRCACSQLDLKLACGGFQTVKKVDPLVLAKTGEECSVNNGAPLYPSSAVSFTYAWNTSFPFKPLSSQIACS